MGLFTRKIKIEAPVLLARMLKSARTEGLSSLRQLLAQVATQEPNESALLTYAHVCPIFAMSLAPLSEDLQRTYVALAAHRVQTLPDGVEAQVFRESALSYVEAFLRDHDHKGMLPNTMSLALTSIFGTDDDSVLKARVMLLGYTTTILKAEVAFLRDLKVV